MKINLNDFIKQKQILQTEINSASPHGGSNSQLSETGTEQLPHSSVKVSGFKVANKKPKKQIQRKKHQSDTLIKAGTTSVLHLNSDDPLAIHQKISEDMETSRRSLPDKKLKLETLDPFSKEYENLKKDIDSIESCNVDMDYYVNSLRHLIEYSSRQNQTDERQKIQLGSRLTTDIFNDLQTDDSKKYKELFVGSITNKHLSKGGIQMKAKQRTNLCIMCKKELEYDDCLDCGVKTDNIEEKYKLSFKEAQEIDTKNISCHNQKEQAFEEILMDIQGNPRKLIKTHDLKWARDTILNGCQPDIITADYIKSVLKSFSRSDLYDYVPQIYREIHDIPKKPIDPACLAAMDVMYDKMKEIEEIAKKNIKSERKNSLWAIYIVRKFLQMFDLSFYTQMLTSLKPETIAKQDEIFREMCNILGWKFI